MEFIFTFVSFTLGDTNTVNHLILGKYRVNGDRLFQVFPGPFDFVLNGASIELDLHDVSFLLALLQQLHLGVGDHTDYCAVAYQFLEVLLNGLAPELILPFLARLGKGLLLALVPSSISITQ